IADIVGSVEPHESQALLLEREKSLHHAVTGGMGRLVDVSDDDVAILGGGDAPGCLPGAEQRAAIAVYREAGDLKAKLAYHGDGGWTVFGGRAAKPFRRRLTGPGESGSARFDFGQHGVRTAGAADAVNPLRRVDGGDVT